MSEPAWRKLGEDHGAIIGNKYEYESEVGKRKEIIQWWSMDPTAELELRLTRKTIFILIRLNLFTLYTQVIMVKANYVSVLSS